jgi:hypothetical protein
VLVDLTAKDRERGDQIKFMKAKAKKREGQDTALPPQIFNSGKYCGVSKVIQTHNTYYFCVGL